MTIYTYRCGDARARATVHTAVVTPSRRAPHGRGCVNLFFFCNFFFMFPVRPSGSGGDGVIVLLILPGPTSRKYGLKAIVTPGARTALLLRRRGRNGDESAATQVGELELRRYERMHRGLDPVHPPSSAEEPLGREPRTRSFHVHKKLKKRNCLITSGSLLPPARPETAAPLRARLRRLSSVNKCTVSRSLLRRPNAENYDQPGESPGSRRPFSVVEENVF